MSTAARRGRPKGPAKATLEFIDAIIEIARKIHPCSVRAIAYKLFIAKLIDSMSIYSVAKVSRACTIAREHGFMPCEWIADPSRAEHKVATWKDPEAYAKAVQQSYRRTKWRHQPVHLSVWSEKETVEGTISPILEKYEVPFQFIHGFSSFTAANNMADANLNREQRTLILYIGDYDPSGMFMSESDLPRRLARYSGDDKHEDIEVDLARKVLDKIGLSIRRVALTVADTIDLGRGLSFPASDKRKDPRYGWFVEGYGDTCWELDALEPTVLRRRLEEEILGVLDLEKWERYIRVEEAERASIVEACRAWNNFEQDSK